MGISRGPKIVKDGLVLHIDTNSERSYVSGSSSWVDLSSNGLSGTLTNNPEYSDILLPSLEITTGSDQRVVFTNNNVFQYDSGSSFSVFCWIYLKGTQDSTTGFLGNAEFQGGGWMLGTIGNDLRVVTNDSTTQNTLNGSTINSNQWYNLGFVYTNNSASLYVNGELDVSDGAVLGTNTSDLWIGDGQQGGWGNTFNGFITQCSIYNRALTTDEILQNYNALKTKYDDYFDTDSVSFINAVIADGDTLTGGEQRAIDYLVKGFKQNGTWDKHQAIYPFVGETSGSHKWNLKDPRDLDAAYRLLFVGSGSHSSDGYKGGNTSGNTIYARTYFTTNDLTYSGGNVDGLMAYYSVKDVAGVAGTSTEIGAGSGTNNYYYMQVEDGAGVFNGFGSAILSPQIGNDGTSDRYVVNSGLSGTTTVFLFKDGTLNTTGSVSQGSAADINKMFIINANGNDLTGTTIFASSQSNRTCGFAALSSNGFTAEEVEADYKVIQTYQQMLNRAN